jgi:hypothetical protein
MLAPVYWLLATALHSSLITPEVAVPTWLKILLIIGGLIVVLVVVTVIATFVVVKRYGPEIVETVQKTGNEGEEYGRRTDNEGCVNEAVARHSHAEGFGDMVKDTIFLRTCLDASRPTPGFCDGVPHQIEFIRGAQWQLQQCKRYGLRPEQQCTQIFQQVQQFCEQPHRRTDDNSNAVGAPPPPLPAPALRQNSNTR